MVHCGWVGVKRRREKGPSQRRKGTKTRREGTGFPVLTDAGLQCRISRMTSMTEAKWVRIMGDYSADPIWGPDGAMSYLEDLPVTQELSQ